MKQRLLIVLLSVFVIVLVIAFSTGVIFLVQWLIGINMGMIALILSAAFTLYVVIYYIITGKLP